MRKFLIGFLLSILMVFPVFAENTPCGPGTEPYTLLEYIESTGTQWIDTGIVANQDTRIVTRARFNSLVDYKTSIFGAGASSSSSTFEGYVWGGKIEFNYWNGLTFGSVVNVGDVIDIDFNKNIITYSINGIQQPTITRPYGVFNSPGTMYLFAINRGEPIVGLTNMYKTQIYDNDTLVRDFVPVRNSGGAIGMYDIVSGEFFGNSGTGEFIAGPVVGGVVGACNVCGTGYYNSIGNDTLCIACPSGLVSPMGSVDADSCGRKIHVGDEIIYLRSVKKTTPSLNFDIDNDGVPDFFLNATLQRTPINSTSQHFLHVGDYYIYDDTVTPEK